ncbi:hypothetical protein BUALT_Bualt08G0087200 [Buddleja alternifolia]|uniref:Uncharacterized protein n=1 Tax=Buddleja alternifolia TaxID=168488 RepID=A0AAV6X483_9LAMI|nr:hypothetical protein BUALT_Bualt08G0087200 [Buddleja alternifolia]
MAVEAENICFENMGFTTPYATICSSFWNIEDGFCFQELQPLDHQTKIDQLHPYVNMASSSSSTSSFSCCPSLPLEIVQSLSSDLDKQRLEMDWFLHLESKRLRRSILQEEARQQAVLLQIYESRIKTLMLQKDEELIVARSKTRDLEGLLNSAEMEAKSWEKKARESEAIVVDLNNRLNRVAQGNDDAASFCGSSNLELKIGDDDDEENMKGCKLCHARRSCVVFFPCRHLCCCKFCDSLLGLCPVCETVKEASLEAFLV